ncbi:TMV resistance protein N-like [Hibiscus syriacus]|uniref:TMV resistance protein N-like n=1 Tax=Hibiscus syriacus TaxID=106335 RepID=A0A6A2ZLM6_HIBSY|nr:TMV resistance protein N-like [Hibiscus syriacus]
MMNTTWRDQQHPSFINFISSFLAANCFRLNFFPISADFIFNCGGLSVAFIFVTKWDHGNVETVFSRAKKLKAQFGHLYVTVNLPTRDKNDSFLCSYFKYEMQLGKPTFVPVQDIEMGFENIVKIAHSCGVSKQQEVKSKLKAEKNQSVQGMENFIRVMTSIPGIDNHDAHALNQTTGSIEGIAKASKECLVETTDLSANKAEIIVKWRLDENLQLNNDQRLSLT